MKVIKWLSSRPVALVNILFIAFILSLFLFQAFRPLDVLEDWTIEITNAPEYRVVDGKRYPIYHPGDVLTFESQSTKLMDARGTTTRTLVCAPTPRQAEREIQLDVIPATRPPGYSPPRESAITLPDVTQYDGLPRSCRLIIDIVYQKIALARNHTEHAESDTFLVEEVRLTPKEAKEQIEGLIRRIEELEALQGEPVSYTPPVQSEKQTQRSPQAESGTPLEDTPPQEVPQEQGIISSTLNRANGLLNGLLRR